jgi:CrcB protein
VWVCVGGAIGSGARYLLSGWMQARLGTAFPWGTLTVNVLGSFLISAIIQIALTTGSISPLVRATLTIGVLGGFTTYSAFNYETSAFLDDRAWFLAGMNLAATLFGCLAAGFLGQAAARAVTSG